MSLSNTMKQNKILMIIFSSVFIIVIAAIFLIIFIPRAKSYTFKTEETNFTVKVPVGWTVIEERRNPGGPDFEPSPDEGIRLLLDENEDNYIQIYSQYGTIALPDEAYDKEEFSTKNGVQGFLYKDKEMPIWNVIYSQDIAPGYYGAVVNFKDKEILNKKQKQIIEILKSLDIANPQPLK